MIRDKPLQFFVPLAIQWGFFFEPELSSSSLAMVMDSALTVINLSNLLNYFTYNSKV